MALTGTFLADFASFDTACKNAEVELRAMESGAEKVGGSLNRMVDGFSGRTIVQNANLAAEAVTRIGGASRLTEAEQARVNRTVTEAIAKYAALGQEAPAALHALAAQTSQLVYTVAPLPAHLQQVSTAARDADATLNSIYGGLKSAAGLVGVTFSAQAIIGFGQSLLATASDLVKVSAQTGVSIENVQRLGYVAEQSGSSLGDLTGAIGKMQLNLNDPKAQQAFRNLNINFADLKALNPYEQFALIADAVGRIPDPVDQSEAAVAIFGKTGIEILPTLKAHFKDLAGEVVVSSTGQIRAIEAAGAALDRAKTNATNWATGLAGNVAMVGEKFGWLQTTVAVVAPFLGHLANIDFNKMLASARDAAAAAAEVGAAIPPVVDVMGDYRKHLDEAGDSVDHLSMREKDMIAAAVALGESNAEIAAGMNLTTNAVDVYVKSLQKAATESDRLAKLEAKNIEETSKLWEEYNVARVSHGGTANDIAIAQIDKWAADLTAQMIKAGGATTAFYDALAATSKEKLAGVGVDWTLINATSQKALNEMAANAQKTYEEMLYGSNTFTREALEAQRLKTIETADAARGMGKEYVDGLARASAEADHLAASIAATAAAAAKATAEMRAMGNSMTFDMSTKEGRAKVPDDLAMWLRAGYSLAQAVELDRAAKFGYTVDSNSPIFRGGPGPRVPGFAAGVENFSGGAAWVGERGPELVTLPRGSNVTPAGGGRGSAHVTIAPGAIVLHYPIMQDLGALDQLGDIVCAAVLQKLRDQGVPV